MQVVLKLPGLMAQMEQVPSMLTGRKESPGKLEFIVKGAVASVEVAPW